MMIGQRFYDPTLGRWTQQDIPGALARPMTLNRYTYVACNPVNAIDPSGLQKCPGAVAAGAFGLTALIPQDLALAGVTIGTAELPIAEVVLIPAGIGYGYATWQLGALAVQGFKRPCNQIKLNVNPAKSFR
jgi:uncharacterized protein RhaS with RHS repeats